MRCITQYKGKSKGNQIKQQDVIFWDSSIDHDRDLFRSHQFTGCGIEDNSSSESDRMAEVTDVDTSITRSNGRRRAKVSY